MSRWVGFLVAGVGAFALVALVVATSEPSTPTPAAGRHAEAEAATDKEDRCRSPRVTGLNARWGGERGRRVKLRVGVAAGRGHVGALYATWGDGRTAIHRLLPRRRVRLELAYSYRQPGTYRISAIVESVVRGCGLLQSPPAVLRVRVPLSHR